MSPGSVPILRVLLADDHPVMRECLCARLQLDGFDVVAAVGDGYSAARMCEALRPDVALLDISMPLLNGIDAAQEIRKVSPATKTMLLTMHGDDLIVRAALRAGVTGYVLKSTAVSTLEQAIQAVCRNEVYLSPGISRAIVDAYLLNHESAGEALSLREREVLQLIAEGKTMKEIGDLLNISARTAETHRARIMTKLNIHHVAGLVRYAFQNRIASIDGP